MIILSDYISESNSHYLKDISPWEITNNAVGVIESLLNDLTDDFVIKDGIAIHRSATVEVGAILKPPVIIHSNCFIGSHAYLRSGVLLMSGVTIGPSVEIKSSIIFQNSSAAHFNFVGDSIIGENVNIEAGAIIANYHNDREDKTISVRIGDQLAPIPVKKFGALIGDGARIGANAVTNPGTIIKRKEVVGRLVHVNQEQTRA